MYNQVCMDEIDGSWLVRMLSEVIEVRDDLCLICKEQQQQPFFVWDYPGEPVPEETLTHPPSWSASMYHDP